MPLSTTFRCPDFTEYRTLVYDMQYQRRPPTSDEIEAGRSLLALEPRSGDFSECSLEKINLLGRSWGLFKTRNGPEMAVRWFTPLDNFLGQTLNVSVRGMVIRVRKV